jgi:hypothetical protein
MCAFLPYRTPKREDRLRVDLTRSPHRLAMTAICAKATAGVDVQRTSQVVAGTSKLGRETGQSRWSSSRLP